MFFKRRGSISSLEKSRTRERDLIELVEAEVDAGRLRGAVLEEIIAAAQARAGAEPDDPSWPFLLGRFLMAAGQPDRAFQALEEAALLDPADPRIATHLGVWYAAAYRAACGDWSNIDLPASCGPTLTAHVARYARIEEVLGEALPVHALASRAREFFEAALTFSLAGRDVRFIKRHLKGLTTLQSDAIESPPLVVRPLSRAS